MSRDGQVAAWITRDNVVRLWDEKSSQIVTLPMPGAAEHLAFAPRGRVVAVTSADGSVRAWQGSALARTLLGHRESVNVEFSVDARSMLSRDNESLRVWHIDDLPSTLAQEGQGVRTLALSPDGSAIATSGMDHTRLFELASGESHALPCADTPAALAWSPDGSRLAVAATRAVFLCNRKGECRALDGVGRAAAVVFSHDGRTLFGAGDGGVRAWSVADLSARVLSDEEVDVSQLELSEDGSKLAVAGLDRRVRVWDLPSGKRLVLDGHSGSVSRARFSHDGKLLATGSADGTIRLWDLASGKARVLDRVEGAASEITLSPDGKKLAFCDASHLVKLWEPSSDRLLLLAGHDGEIRDLTFSPAGTLIASASVDHTVRLWDAIHGHAAQVLRGHSATVHRVLFGADGRSVISAGDDGSVRRWPLRPALGENGALRGWLRSLSTARIDGDGNPVTP
jgi:WD40 repeat protein